MIPPDIASIRERVKSYPDRPGVTLGMERALAHWSDYGSRPRQTRLALSRGHRDGESRSGAVRASGVGGDGVPAHRAGPDNT